MSYFIRTIDGMAHPEFLHAMNELDPSFPALRSRHLADGFWWVAQQYETNVAVAFAGMVPFFDVRDGIGYFKRVYVLPEYCGQGLQGHFMRLREAKAPELKWWMLVSECASDNVVSAKNFIQAGFEEFDPEQRWGASNSIYFRKYL